MGKKLQICVWTIIAVAVFILIGGCVYNLARATNETPIHPEVTFEVENVGTIKMELYPEYAPNTVKNIIKLVESGYYNNKVLYGKDELCLYMGRNAEGEAENPMASLIFDEIEAGTEADYEYSINGEFVANGFNQNTLNHKKGIVSLIRNNYGTGFYEQSYNSGNAQLGIMLSDDSSNLNGVYAAFARITEGLDLIEKIYNESEVVVEEVSEGEQESAIKAFATAPVIKNATVDTHGINYGNPEIEEAFDYEAYMYEMMSAYYGEE